MVYSVRFSQVTACQREGTHRGEAPLPSFATFRWYFRLLFKRKFFHLAFHRSGIFSRFFTAFNVSNANVSFTSMLPTLYPVAPAALTASNVSFYPRLLLLQQVQVFQTWDREMKTKFLKSSFFISIGKKNLS